jgi:hypothetical protein
LHAKKNARQLLDVAAERERLMSAFQFKHKSVPRLLNRSRVDDAFMEWGISRSMIGLKVCPEWELNFHLTSGGFTQPAVRSLFSHGAATSRSPRPEPESRRAVALTDSISIRVKAGVSSQRRRTPQPGNTQS